MALLLLACATAPASAVNSTPDPTWMVRGKVNAIERVGDTVFLGGLFDLVGPPGDTGFAAGQPRANLVALNALSGEPLAWNPGTDGEVLALDSTDTTLYVGGAFTHAAGVPRNYIAAFDVTSGNLTSWNPFSSDIVRSISVFDTKTSLLGVLAYVGGDFVLIGNQNRNHAAAIDTTYGQASGWDPGPDGPVYAVLARPEGVYVGGQFNSVFQYGCCNLINTRHLPPGATYQSWIPAPSPGPVYALAGTSTTVYIGGAFTSIGPAGQQQPRSNLAATPLGLPPTQGTPTSLDPAPDGAVRSIAIARNVVYVGGAFSTFAGQPRSGVASFDNDANAVTDWNPGASGADPTVRAVQFTNQTVYVGGGFTGIGGAERSGFASFSTAPANTAPPAISGDPSAGSTLTCGVGEWSGSTPQSYAFEWLRDNAGTGVTAADYAVGAGDVGHELVCRVTATNLAGSGTAQSAGLAIPVPPVPPPPPDTTPPGATLEVLGERVRNVLRRGLRVRVRCTERCRATVTVQIDAKTAKRYGLGKKTTAIGRESKSLKARKKTTILVKFKKKFVTGLSRARTLKLRVVIVAKDSAGNSTRKIRKVTLK